MKVVGIIAEYNPLHNGHARQLRLLREDFGADGVIVCMSGDFTQRGVPAIVDKRTRAEMALLTGADLVLELPALFATGSAELFAGGAVSLFDALGCVSHLSFGMENADSAHVTALQTLAEKLLLVEDGEKEAFSEGGMPDAAEKTADGINADGINADRMSADRISAVYRESLRSYTRRGLSFPAARERALSETFSGMEEAEEKLLHSPNNLLAVEYVKALLRRKSEIQILPVQREGAPYHAETLPEASDAFSPNSGQRTNNAVFPNSGQGNNNATFLNSGQGKSSTVFFDSGRANPSATALRRALRQKDAASVSPYIPAEALSLLFRQNGDNFVFPDDFSAELAYRLTAERERGFAAYLDVSEELSDKIIKWLPRFTTASAFAEGLKSKDLTRTRIDRALLHILLGITKEAYGYAAKKKETPYARVLGLRRDSTLFPLLKRKAGLPVVCNPAKGLALLNEEWERALLHLDIRAAEIYGLALRKRCASAVAEELRAPVVTI